MTLSDVPGPMLDLSPTGSGEPKRQHWGLDREAGVWRIDVMHEPGDRHTWRFRRDGSISAPWSAITATTDDGIPYLRPEASLLYKAKEPRPHDQADFDVVLPLLDRL